MVEPVQPFSRCGFDGCLGSCVGDCSFCLEPPDAEPHVRWHLMLTNLNKEEATVAQLTEVYRARWAIEIQFRAWKQALNLTKALNRKSNEHHMQAFVLAAMIAHQLGMVLTALLVNQADRSRLSFEKLYGTLAQYCLS